MNYSWPVVYGDTPPADYLGLSEEDRSRWEESAADYLRRWTGRAFGLGVTTVELTRRGYCETLPRRGWAWDYREPRFHGYELITTNPDWVMLPGPVDSIIEVLIDDVPLSLDDLRVQDHRWLVGVSLWPLDVTVTVTYRRGTEVPVGGQLAAGRLAVELWLSTTHPRDCGLPERMQTITRQGVTVAMLDSFDDIDRGHTGIWSIDSWIASVTRAPVGSRVYSPDVRRPSSTSWSR